MACKHWQWLLVAVTLAGCGPSAGTDDDGGSDGPTSADGTGATSAGPGSADAATTTGSTCEDLISSVTPGATVAFTATAAGADPVWTGAVGCGGGLAMELRDAAGQPVIFTQGSECFPVTCEGFLDQGTCEIGCNDCAPPQAMRFEAGASAMVNWGGLAYSSHALPAECGDFQDCNAQCLRAEEVVAGEYTAVVTVYSGCDGDCECDVPDANPCGLYGQVTLTGPSTVEVAFTYPSDTAVAIAL